MPQVRIIYTDGTRDEIDVESEESVTAKLVGGRVVVFADAPGSEGLDLVSDCAVDDVASVITTPWSESDGECEMEETTVWSSPEN